MKHPHCLRWSAGAALALLVAQPALAATEAASRAASQATGSIAGRVQNVVTGQYLSNAQNIFNVPETLQRYGSQTPAYARVTQVLTTGIQLTFGLKGQF